MHNLKNIFVIAGGTAGHTLPAIELSNELVNRNYKIIFITDIRMFDFVNKNIKQNSKNIKVLCFKGRGLHKSNLFKNIKSIFLLICSVMQSFINILSYRPKLAYGFGGGITVPPLMICRIFKIPIIPRIKVDAKIFGIIPAMLNLIDLNKTINIIKISIKTIPNDFTWEINKD